MILVSMSLPKLLRFESPYLGRLFVPAHYGNVAGTVARGIACAADNGCFNGLDEPKFLSLLEYLRGQPLLFMAVPDVPGDAIATKQRWVDWAPRVRTYGVRLAYVLQDGETSDNVPWDEIAAVFIGGTTRWKLGPAARRLVVEANRRGKHVHMGRVNTLQRLRYAFRIGCDTVDGSAWGKWSDKKLPRALQLLRRLDGARNAHRLDSFGSARPAPRLKVRA